jgi:hypothetical protein
MAMLVYGGAGAWAAALEAPETKPASEVTGTTAMLHGVLNPQNAGDPGTYEFLFKASTTECGGEGGQTTATGTALGHKQEAVSAGVTQLLPSTQYAFCLLARNEVGETALGSPVTFTTPAVVPTVVEQSVSNVGSSTATVNAQIDPGGEPTSYRVEYGTTSAYGSITPQDSLPASSTPVSVRVELGGLEPGTEYHFRFLAQNPVGVASPGADMVFTAARSLGASGLTLPDNRAYEMVSPPDGHDVYVPETTNLINDLGAPSFNSSFPFRASADGNAVAYNGAAPSSGGNGIRLPNGTGNQFMARRGPHGWAAADILPSPPAANELIQHEEYQAFSSDLSVGMAFSAEGLKRALPLAAGASVCDGLYARTTSDGAFHALFSETPIPTPNVCARETFAGASVDGSHVLFESNVALNPPEAEPAEGEGRENLYESVGGRLASVNVLDGKPVPNATFGSEFKSIFNPESEPGPFTEFTDFSNVISVDGSRVFWTDLNSNRVYVREDGAITVPVSAGEAQFWTATPDGRYVFYTEGEQLWRFDVGSKTREALTPGGAEAEVRGVVGASSDGSYVYFVAGGALAEGTARRSCKPISVQEAEVEAAFHESRITETEKRERLNTLRVENREDHEGEIPLRTGCTLYVRHAGHTTQVTTLSPDDDSLPGPFQEGQFGDWMPNLGHRTAQVAPDGHGVVFESRQRLTGYDNLVNGGAVNEAFVYNTDSVRLSCVSCDPTGAPPSAAGLEAGEEALLPRNLLKREPAISTYMLRWISEDGTRVFFNTAQSLVSQDTNGQADVYEWEREGSPSCPKLTVPRPNGGCVFLLSGGQGNSSHGAVFVDASSSGDDVFFATRAKLVPGDHDENMKLYDARVGGGFPEPSLACTGTGCQGVPPGQPLFGTPSSVTFAGTGNFPPVFSAGHVSLTKAQRLARALKACRGTRAKRKRLGCEKHARRLYAPAHQARKTTRARGGRRHQ